jgi:hypothetical protein
MSSNASFKEHDDEKQAKAAHIEAFEAARPGVVIAEGAYLYDRQTDAALNRKVSRLRQLKLRGLSEALLLDENMVVLSSR